jgi:hypothetical protein
MKKALLPPLAALVTLGGCVPMTQGTRPAAPYGVTQTGTAGQPQVWGTGQPSGMVGGGYGTAPTAPAWGGQSPAGQVPGYGYGQAPGTARQPAVMPDYGQIPGMAGQPAAVPGYGQAGGLIDLLAGQLGISPPQALGGAGALFGLARQRLSPADFGQLSAAVPGMDAMIAAAPRVQASVPASSGLMGAAGTLMGGQAASLLGSLAPLAGSFQSLGLGPEMIGQFVPVVLQYVQQQGGPATMNLLRGALY